MWECHVSQIIVLLITLNLYKNECKTGVFLNLLYISQLIRLQLVLIPLLVHISILWPSNLWTVLWGCMWCLHVVMWNNMSAPPIMFGVKFVHQHIVPPVKIVHTMVVCVQVSLLQSMSWVYKALDVCRVSFSLDLTSKEKTKIVSCTLWQNP